MRTIITAAALFLLTIGVTVPAHADLDSFLSSLNVQARADMNGFSAKLSAQFGIPEVRVQALLKTVDNSADAFMCLQLGQMSRKEPETVLRTYQRSKSKGWGAIAKELGIKPGSAEFHALKRGDFKLTGDPEGGAGGGHGKGKGKGRGKNN
ncbi:hypothetical protein [Trichlorobacter ammonificans]|uniref:Uncharacterized protein n=1 Tax=Trichlorobacter ammonificans TaxID=2916410 RepID=A0ABM9D9P1_9BACT|nr:hypothetical protein [Trichlorobacter ammonificans]CAH2031873.1 conserved exported protein of unknown function [Trichlorobacter ammonificans]